LTESPLMKQTSSISMHDILPQSRPYK
jgi:hypothetical protein